jgi:hypothetical protein
MILRKIFRKLDSLLDLSHKAEQKKIKYYLKNGRIPWSKGYHEYKWQQIERVISNENILNELKLANNIQNHGKGIDERIIEYPWIITNLSDKPGKLLDAGSTFNFKKILSNRFVSCKKISILTLFPENANFNELQISYIYADLRDIPFKENYFEEIVCQSTLEHIGMDNTMYGSKEKYDTNVYIKNYDYLKAIQELVLVLKNRGTFLITVPYGRFENHGFFQQFDSEMINRIKNMFEGIGSWEDIYFKYSKDGWGISNKTDCDECQSYNPHTGIGKNDDGAAHSRAICCIKFIKN